MEETERASTVPKWFAEVVGAHAQHIAIAMPHETVSYEELDRRTAKMARAFLALGVGKGTRIALMTPDGILWSTVFLAALRIGALVTTISTLCTPPELAHILRNSDAQILIAVRRFLRHDYAKNLNVALPDLSDAKAEKLRLTEAPYLRSIWLDDAENLGWARSVDDLIKRADEPDAPDAALLAAIEGEVAPSDDAVVIYTSGSTSATPKAVVHTQRTLARHPHVLAQYNVFQSGDRTMPLLPAFWAGGITAALQVWDVGGTVVYPASPDADAVLDAIERFDVNRIIVWHMAAKIRAAAVARGTDIDKIIGLGAPLLDEHGQVIPLHLRHRGFGMSESFAQHSGEFANVGLPEDKVGASGRAVHGVERRIVNPETGKEVPPGEVGELQLRGGAMLSGFYKVERNKVFTPDGFYPTKDLARIDADGYAYFVDRMGSMIKTKSANVSAFEVEAALQALPEVDLAIVAGLPDPELGEIVAAAVVPAKGTTPSEDTLRTALRGALSSFKIPRHIVFIAHDDVPRTATGKAKLFELSELIASRIPKSAPETGTAQQSLAG